MDAALNALPIRLGWRRAAAVLAALVVLGAVAALGPVAGARAEPGALGAKRAEVHALQAQLQELDARAGLIVEAYNRARHNLGIVNAQLRVNAALLRKARADHALAQRRLASRLVAIYREGQPSIARLILTAGSLSEAVDELAMLRRVEGADRGVVRDLRGSGERIRGARLDLLASRRAVRAELATAAHHRAAIEVVLRQRRTLLQRSQGELAMLEGIERRRQAAQLAIARARFARLAARQGRIESQRAGADGVAGLALGAGEASGSAPLAAPGAGRTDVVDYAMQLIGTPYQWGGSTPEGFDCSGFVRHVYGRFGKDLPHYTGGQWEAGARVGREQLEPGDLVFFDGLGHDGIYIGGGQFIHSPHTGDSVKVSSLDSGWYGRRYVGAVRPH